MSNSIREAFADAGMTVPELETRATIIDTMRRNTKVLSIPQLLKIESEIRKCIAVKRRRVTACEHRIDERRRAMENIVGLSGIKTLEAYKREQPRTWNHTAVGRIHCTIKDEKRIRTDIRREINEMQMQHHAITEIIRERKADQRFATQYKAAMYVAATA